MTVWEQNTRLDFENGTMENITMLNNGEMVLQKYLNERVIEDNFKNDFNISYSKNIKLNTEENKWELRKNIGNFDSFYYGPYVDNTADGGYIFVGGTTTYGAGGFDVLLIKVDKDLNEEWKKTFGTWDYEVGFCVQQTSDYGFIIVGDQIIDTPDVLLIKTDGSGNEQWTKTFKMGAGHSVLQTQDGGYIIAGNRAPGMSKWDGWLIKTDSSGNEHWNKTFGGIEHDYIYSVKQTDDNGYIMTGISHSYGGEDDDLWVIKTDSLGKEKWNKTYGGSSNDVGYSVKQTSDRGYVIVGRSNSYASYSYDFWVIKIDSNGIEQWNRSYDFNNGVADIGRSIIQTNDNGYIIIGDSDPYTGTESEIIFFKINSLGNLQWNKTFGKDGYDRGFSIIKDSEGDYVISVKMDDKTKLIKIDNFGNIKSVYGELISKNLLENEKAASINSFRYKATIPIDNKIRIQFSQDNKSWYSSDGIKNTWTFLENRGDIIDISDLNWLGSNLYYKLNFTSRNLTSPSIEYAHLYFNKYIEHGTYESEPFNSSGNLSWLNLNWTSQTPKGTQINFQLRTGTTIQDLFSKKFLGPDGRSESYYTSPGTPIWFGQINESWIQYKVYLSTDDTSKTPVLSNVSISFDHFPILNSPQIYPSTGNITTDFNFTVRYIDYDNELPTDIYVVIDDIKFVMKESNLTDLIILDGKEYFYKTKLKAGNHSYYFIGFDNDLNNITKLYNLNVTFGPLNRISVIPSVKELFVGEYQVFTAKSFDLDNNNLSISPYWEVSGGGTIDQTGNFTALVPGYWVIYASSFGIYGRAEVTVFNVKNGNDSDIDNDLIPDNWEIQYELNTTDPFDANLDFDNDNLTNLGEFLNQTNPLNPDTDSDGYNDGLEVENGTDPLNEDDYPKLDEPKPDKDKTIQNNYYFIYIISGISIITILIIFGILINKKYKKNK
jgi:hypothetical protein